MSSEIKKLICPLCNNSVAQFKKNCHVIPRWACKLTKNKGINTQISQNGIKEKNQVDEKGAFWCENCEKDSQKYDRYISVTFKEPIKIHTNEELNKKRSEYIGNHELVYKFVIITLLKHHFYKKQNNENFLNEDELVMMKNYYLESEFIQKQYPYSIMITEIKPNSIVIYPSSSDNNHDYFFTCGGFAFYLFRQPQESINLNFVGQEQIFILHDGIQKNRLGSYPDLYPHKFKITKN